MNKQPLAECRYIEHRRCIRARALKISHEQAITSSMWVWPKRLVDGSCAERLNECLDVL